MKRVFSGRLAVSILTLAVGAGSVLAQGQSGQAPGRESDELNSRIVVHSMNPHEMAPTAGGTGSLSPIISHGGPVMVTPTAYLIWYGNWNQSNGSDTAAGQTLVRDFLYGINNSPYFQINTTYKGPSGFVNVGAEITVTAGSSKKPLSDSDIRTLVVNAITNGKLPLDGKGVYFVLTSSDVAKSGFCTQYCGWHTYTTVQGIPIQYSFVGNANRCLNGCAAQTISPNGNAGVDGMLSVVAHELEEATTDPQLNAWYDSAGAENADKCAWTFGQNQTQLLSGAYYNMTLPAVSVANRNYLIQRNLSASDNKCYVQTGAQ
jgi:Phosphate-induced protein 1 conserved region